MTRQISAKSYRYVKQILLFKTKVNCQVMSQLSVVDNHTLAADNQELQQESLASGEESAQTLSPDKAHSSDIHQPSQDEQIRAFEYSLQELDMTADSIPYYQHADTELRTIMDYLSHGNLPKSQERSEESDYLMVQGILLHCRMAKAK